MKPSKSQTKTLSKVDSGWYNRFIEECRDIIVEHSFASRWALIEGYHALGQRILEEHDNFKRSTIYGKKVVATVAKSLGRSERSIEYAIKFAEKFPDINRLPEGKNVSWHKVCHKYILIAEGHKDHVVIIVCPKCGFKISKEKKT